MMNNNAYRYTTRASKNRKVGCFMEQINITRGKTLTIASMDTESLQVNAYPSDKKINTSRRYYYDA